MLELLGPLDAIDSASERVHILLSDADRFTPLARSMILDGATISEVVTSQIGEFGPIRRDLERAMDDYRSALLGWRATVIRHLLATGSTKTDVAKLLGISRQRVSNILESSV